MTNASIGHFDGMEAGVLNGWSWNPAIGGPAPLDIYADGEHLTSLIPDAYRADLERAGYGDGRCAFSYILPARFRDGATHEIAIKLKETSAHAHGSPISDRIPMVAFSKKMLSGTRPAAALKGKEKWWFLCHDVNGCIEQLRGAVEFAPEHLQQYGELFDARRDYFNRTGIPYVFTVLPGKETVYSDMLPEGLTPNPLGMPAEQLLGYLQRNGHYCPLDMRPAMRTARRDFPMPLYYHTDSHWNYIGAFVAYQVMMQQVRQHIPSISVRDWDDFTMEPRPNAKTDLRGKEQMVWQHSEIVPANEQIALSVEEELFPIPRTPAPLRQCDPEPHLNVSRTRPTLVFEQATPNLPTAVMFRDSYTDWLLRYLTPHFRRIVYVWKPEILPDVIEKEKPDVVLQMMVDRFMVRIPSQ